MPTSTGMQMQCQKTNKSTEPASHDENWDWQQTENEEYRQAEEGIKRIIYRHLGRLLLALIVCAVVAIGVFQLLQQTGISLDKDRTDPVLAGLNILVSAGMLCVALVSAVVTYFVAMLAYRLAAQAKMISEETLNISKLAVAISQRESLRESSKHAAEIRAALNRFGTLCENYLELIPTTSLSMLLSGRRHAVLLQWQLQCQMDGEVWETEYPMPYAEKKAVLLALANAQIQHFQRFEQTDDDECLQWQRLEGALQADVLADNLSLLGVMEFWGETSNWKLAAQRIKELLGVAMELWRFVQSDSALLELLKADNDRESAYSSLYKNHRELHELFQRDGEVQLEFILRAGVLTMAYSRHIQSTNVNFMELFKHMPWMALLSQFAESKPNFFTRNEIGVESIIRNLRHFFGAMHITNAEVAQIFHIEHRPDISKAENERFLLASYSVEKIMDTWERFQECIDQTHSSLPQTFSQPASTSNILEAVETGILRWKFVAQMAVDGSVLDEGQQ